MPSRHAFPFPLRSPLPDGRRPADSARASAHVIEIARFARNTALQDLAAFGQALGEHLAAGANGARPALLVFEIDRYQLVNDSFGRATGETVLRTICDVLAAMVARPPLLSRLAPCVFALFIAGNETERTALAFARRLQRRFAEGFRVQGRDYRFTLSVGIAFFPCDGVDAHSLIRYASSAHHAVMHAGGDRIERHPR